jgi:hypothetical protein
MQASAILAASLIGFGMAGSAAAFSFTPKSVAFSATGPLTLMKPGGQITCTIGVKGVDNALGVARITAVSFIAGPAACFNTAANNLPWPAKATSATLGKITKVVLIGAFTGTCGPAPVVINVSATGVWSFNGANLPPSCVISGSLPTGLRIVP